MLFLFVSSKHKPQVQKHTYRKVIVPGVHHTVMCDLIEYTKNSYVRNNDGYRYILVVIDAFSRFAYTRPLKTKTAEEVSEQIANIFASMTYTPSYIGSDKGREFTHENKYMRKRIIDKYNVKMYYMSGKRKGSIVERWNRTFKSTLERYFDRISTLPDTRKRKRWIDVLQDMTNNINNRFNRSIQMKPADVTVADNPKIRKILYGSSKPLKSCRFSIGDKVRIPVKTDIFAKGYRKSMLEI